MIAHVDRFIDNGKREGLLEIKTADVRFAWLWGEPGTDSVPDIYNLQCQHYLAVTGLKWADIAVLIGGNDFRVYRVPRNDDLIKNLIRIEKEFWTNHVEKQVPPPIDGTESAKLLLSRLYPQDSGREVLADEKINAVVQEYFEFRDEIEKLEEAKLLRENQIKEEMGKASLLKGPGYRISWKTTKERKDVNYKAILAEARVPEEMIQKYTKMKPGTRPFRPTRFKEKGE